MKSFSHVTARASILALLLGIASQADARTTSMPGPVNVQTMHLTPGPNDLSMKLLHAILGDWSGSNGQTLLGQLFLYFNSGVLIFASLLFIYIAVMSVLRTAEDGEVLGHGWSTIWIPLRVFIGMAFIFPTASGFSIVQILVLWLAGQSIGFANAGFVKAVEGLIGGQGNVVAARLVDAGASQNLMATILRAESCIAEQNRVHASPSNPGYKPFQRVVEREGASGTINLLSTGGGGTISWGNIDTSLDGFTRTHCGMINIPSDGFSETSGANAVASSFQSVGAALSSTWSGVKLAKGAIRSAQLEGINAAADILSVPAQNLATVGTQADGSVSPNRAPTSAQVLDAINRATNAYRRTIADASQGNLLLQNEALTSGFIEDAKKNGWITAGGWYFQMTRISTEINKVSAYVPTVTGFERGSVVAVVDPMGNTDGNKAELPARRTNIDASLDALIDQASMMDNNPTIARLGQNGAGTSQGGIAGVMNTWSNSATGTATSYFAEAVSIDPNNPKNAVVQLKSIGDYIITSAELIFVGKQAAKFVGKNPIVSSVQKFTDKNTSMLEPLGFLAFFIGASLLIFGVTLAYWIPMAPFVIWMGSVLGWLISVLEMVVAAPIWAAAHLHPEGEGMAGKWGSNGYMIMTEVFMRPFLMVVGLVFAMIVVDPFLKFSSALFFNTMDTVNADSVSGVVTMVVFIIIYTSFCLAMVNRIFNLITIIPKSVLRIVGASGGAHDQGQDAAQAVEISTKKGLSSGKDAFSGGVGAAAATSMKREQAAEKTAKKDAALKRQAGSNNGDDENFPSPTEDGI